MACDSPGDGVRSAVSPIGIPPRLRCFSRAVPSVVLFEEVEFYRLSHEALVRATSPHWSTAWKRQSPSARFPIPSWPRLASWTLSHTLVSSMTNSGILRWMEPSSGVHLVRVSVDGVQYV